MEIKGINYVCFSVSNLVVSIEFYKNVLKGDLLVSGKSTAYFNIGGLWVALNEEVNVPRTEIKYSYTHMAFSINDNEFEEWYEWLQKHYVNILEGRERHIKDKKSIYFTDPDGHKLELHTGNLNDRLTYYKDEKPHMTLYNDVLIN
ncbi:MULTISPECIES: metallothiol transferase FosB [Staphylococcus]|uniref:metallothiol transferase FosB n=1 Tax=Staphylococcus TaxID=1279 RepID=UPI000CD10AF5|nr:MULTISPECIES: metallothiol transferase FosB [Staphylococcus]MDI9230740.1 metallothiol transferase FosB [Staphylococcus caprae]POA04592.1 metallothiol transferase fosB [Staphylococcus caprae]SUL94342.1 Fosfomycin resistance protein FosB [Staphylococcus caprae]HCG74475.1 metallothiol transferase FosB [Staphylococcus sp.]